MVGGGFSGIETAGELADFLDASPRYYKQVCLEDLRICLLHSGDRLLLELSPRLGAFTLKHMRARGIDVRLKARVIAVTGRDVHLDGRGNLPAGTVMCTIGTQPRPLLADIPAMKNRGRLGVNPDLSVAGVDGVWAAGDCAAVVNAYDAKVAAPTARFAEAEAAQLAANVVARINGKPTQVFRYRPKGQLCSGGHNKAVAEIFGLKISGFIAWLMWRGRYLLRIPTLARKARLFLEWNWAMFFPPVISHFGNRRSQRRSSAATPATPRLAAATNAAVPKVNG